MQIDQIYIIALDGNTEEVQAKISERLETLGLPDGIPYEIIVAHNGKKDPIPDGLAPYSGWNLGEDHWNEWWRRDMLPGEIGCAISHFWAWNRIAQMADDSKVLILEEDFWGVKPITELKEYSKSWDILILGHWRFNQDEEVIEYPWVKLDTFYNSQAYRW